MKNAFIEFNNKTLMVKYFCLLIFKKYIFNNDSEICYLRFSDIFII